MLDSSIFVELKASGNLPSPRGSALKVLDLCQRDNLTLPELIHAVQVDPAMVGRLLKMANSAAFGRPRPVVALTPDVLMSIGIQSVRQLVLAFSLVSGNRQGQCADFDYEAFWSRSAATGVAMQLLGAATRAAPPPELFTVGLLANVGRLALSAIHPLAYGKLLQQVGGRLGNGLTALEEHAFGYSHAEVASAMMQDWGLPRLFCDAVLRHEQPDADGPRRDSRSAQLVRCIHLASRLAELCFVQGEERRAGFLELLPLAHELEIADGNLAKLGDQMLSEWKEWSQLLEIAVREVTPFTALNTAVQQVGESVGECRKLSVLVIDEDAAAAERLKLLLESGGHRVNLAQGGHDGLVEVLDRQPQLVCVDLCADLDRGLELIRTLRQTELGRSVYIMVLTRPDDDERLTMALEAGADDYLDKPVVPKLLDARLRAGHRMIREQQLLRLEQETLRRRLLELAITSQHAREAALTDVLTGLYNRRHAIDRLKQEWAAADRGMRPLAVLMLDIDYFKAVNDSHGHDAGDEALRQVADTLRAISRMSDVVCRYGGEEFLVIAPDTSLDGALQLAERMRSAVAQRNLALATQCVKLTISLGVAVKGDGISGAERLLKAADDALYRAKQYGRNRVESGP
ncbi:MAG: diguanylate cyclase [Rhodocyclales bacterium]|nr:diguanylate cyclase [Rhodocyclales bacterium]